MHYVYGKLIKLQRSFILLYGKLYFFKKVLRFFYIKTISPFGFLFYKIMRPIPYRALFNDKVVAIVGPAADLSGQALGKRIDQADVVVKFNRMVDFSHAQEVDYGSKIDILVHGLLPGYEPGRCGKVAPLSWKKRGIDTVVYPFYLDSTGYCVANYFIKGGGRLISYKALPNEYLHLSERLQSRPTSGALAIMLALKGQAKRVEVYGFSFFQTEHNRDYFKCGKDVLVDEKSFKHSSDNEFELMKKLQEENKNLYFVFPNLFR